LALNSYWRTSLAVFALTAIVLFWVCANLLTLNPDEGIYLDGALRVMNGQAPYRDFFVHTGPGTYWLYASVFRVFGPSLVVARLPLICEVAAITAAVFLLTANLATYTFGLATTVVFFAAQTRDLGMLALNHRWDSSALGFLAVVPAYAALRSGSRLMMFASGMLAAAAAWCTPTLGIVALGIALWIAVSPGLRKLLLPFLSGMAAVSAVCVSILAAEQAIKPMLEHFLWTSSNYSAANRVPYGWAGTGYGEIGSGLGIVGWVLYSALLGVVAAPAVLPILTWLAWAIYFAIRRRVEQPILFLILCSGALVASTYPRWDIGHLLYVAPISYVLAAAFLHRSLPAKTLPPLFCLTMFVAIFVWTPGVAGLSGVRRVTTSAGVVRVKPEDEKLLHMILGRVRPGDSLFVFPYFPTMYFLTHGVNPTRFSYLQPGLMTPEDEAIALQELQGHPPQWVFYDYVRPEEYLKHWPSSDPSRLRLNSIEEFLSARYHPLEKLSHRLGDFSLLERGSP
jgi:4-amino-4-deoxy-L-arabinose transferase-like glycosyltransferase